MLEHQMTVLKAVADNHDLFKKELIKSLDWLDPEEKSQLRSWLQENFPGKYSDLINDTFHGKNPTA